jgi:hypothetical protein
MQFLTVGIFFMAIVNMIVFVIFFSENLLLVYIKASDFHMLILDPPTLWNLFISSNSLLVKSSGFCMYRIIPSANRGSLTYSFPF